MDESLKWFLDSVPDENDRELLRRKFGQQLEALNQSSVKWSPSPQDAFKHSLEVQLEILKKEEESPDTEEKKRAKEKGKEEKSTKKKGGQDTSGKGTQEASSTQNLSGSRHGYGHQQASRPPVDLTEANVTAFMRSLGIDPYLQQEPSETIITGTSNTDSSNNEELDENLEKDLAKSATWAGIDNAMRNSNFEAWRTFQGVEGQSPNKVE